MQEHEAGHGCQAGGVSSGSAGFEKPDAITAGDRDRSPSKKPCLLTLSSSLVNLITSQFRDVGLQVEPSLSPKLQAPRCSGRKWPQTPTASSVLTWPNSVRKLRSRHPTALRSGLGFRPPVFVRLNGVSEFWPKKLVVLKRRRCIREKMDLIDLEEETIDAEILDSMAVSQDFSGKK